MTAQYAAKGPPRDPRLSGADAAMRRAAASATHRAARTKAAVLGSSGLGLASDSVDERHPSFDAVIGKSLKESERTLIWIVDNINGLKVPDLPASKRLALAASCLHMAIEHGQAIVILVLEKCFGSALALQRPLIEAYFRGVWLRHCATDHEVDRAGSDTFPTNRHIVDAVEAYSGAVFSQLMGQSWNYLCSYIHSGFHQIGARLSADGLRSNYRLHELQQALSWSDVIQLASAFELADAVNNESLRTTIAKRLASQSTKGNPHERQGMDA